MMKVCLCPGADKINISKYQNHEFQNLSQADLHRKARPECMVMSMLV